MLRLYDEVGQEILKTWDTPQSLIWAQKMKLWALDKLEPSEGKNICISWAPVGAKKSRSVFWLTDVSGCGAHHRLQLKLGLNLCRGGKVKYPVVVDQGNQRPGLIKTGGLYKGQKKLRYLNRTRKSTEIYFYTHDRATD